MPLAKRAFRPLIVGVVTLGLWALAPLQAFRPDALEAKAQGRPGPQSVAPVAERLIDAVVNISTTQSVKGPQGVPLPDVPKGSPFEDLFDDFFKPKNGQSQTERKVSSLGSGFVIDAKEGLVVTNYHVIEGADEITLNFHDGTKLKVEKVVGRDTKTDLALLKATPKKPLTAVKFGSSTNLRVGDWVLAIGNPFGLGGSVTLGIISAKQRDINSGPYDDFLQTDASINKGNSGGPLFNMEGEVIGVNTAIISPSGGSIGIGFAIPSDTATSVVDQLRDFGEARRGWLGIKIQAVTEEIAESLGVPENVGALIGETTPDGPAAKAGIESGDIITKYDGREVSTMRGLPRMVAQTAIGKTVDVEILRKGQKLVRKAMIGRLIEDAPDKSKTADAPPPAMVGASLASLGLKLAPISDELRKKFKLDEKMKGLVVTDVDKEGAAAKKGIKVGDVIVEVAQEPVTTVEDAIKGVEKMRAAGRKTVLLRVDDAKGELRFVAVPLN